jgi:hypothetical protein
MESQVAEPHLPAGFTGPIWTLLIIAGVSVVSFRNHFKGPLCPDSWLTTTCASTALSGVYLITLCVISFFIACAKDPGFVPEDIR